MIKLQNFRCFAEQSITFRRGINLLIGDNASGKTSILKACKYVLSSFFSGFSDENTNWVNPDIDDFRVVTTGDGVVLPEQPIHIYFNIDDILEHQSLINIQPSFIELDEPYYPYVLTKNSKRNSRALITGIKGYKDYAHSLQNSYISKDGQHNSLLLFFAFDKN